MRVPLAACCEPTVKLWQSCKVLDVFEHKTQHLLIHASYTPSVVFWHISNTHPMILMSEICFDTATFCTAAIFCEILLDNQQLVVITHELMYGVRAAHR